MFGLQQASAKNVKFCSDQPSGLKKPQICSDGAIINEARAPTYPGVRPPEYSSLLKVGAPSRRESHAANAIRKALQLLLPPSRIEPVTSPF
jgi:hypothetical protein